MSNREKESPENSGDDDSSGDDYFPAGSTKDDALCKLWTVIENCRKDIGNKKCENRDLMEKIQELLTKMDELDIHMRRKNNTIFDLRRQLDATESERDAMQRKLDAMHRERDVEKRRLEQSLQKKNDSQQHDEFYARKWMSCMKNEKSTQHAKRRLIRKLQKLPAKWTCTRNYPPMKWNKNKRWKNKNGGKTKTKKSKGT